MVAFCIQLSDVTRIGTKIIEIRRLRTELVGRRDVEHPNGASRNNTFLSTAEPIANSSDKEIHGIVSGRLLQFENRCRFDAFNLET